VKVAVEVNLVSNCRDLCLV